VAKIIGGPMNKKAFRSFYPWYTAPWYILIAKLLLVPIKSFKQPLNNSGEEKPMSKLTYETDEAIFVFDLPPAIDKLEHYVAEHNADEARELLNFIAESSEKSITVPTDYDYFGYIGLDLINKNIGSIKCKICNKTYSPDQLKSTIVGHGKSPLSINSKQKGGIKKVFKKKQKPPGMLGGRGYECPKGHDLISMITWRT